MPGPVQVSVRVPAHFFLLPEIVREQTVYGGLFRNRFQWPFQNGAFESVLQDPYHRQTEW
jgi:hypothetical protein